MSQLKVNAPVGNGNFMSINQENPKFWLIHTLGIVIGDFADI